MDGEIMEGDQILRRKDWYEVIGEKQEVDSTYKVKHNEKNDKSLVETMMKLDERGRVTETTDEDQVL